MKPLVPTTLLISVCGSSLFAADPLAGTWKQIQSKSQNDNPPQTIYTAAPNGVSIQNAPGKPVLATYDGKDSPTGVGTTISVNKLNDHTLVVTTKMNGQVRGTSTRTASSDGKHLIEVTEGKGVAGPIKQTQAFDRVGSASGGDAFLGTWREDYAKRKTEPPPTYTIKVDGDQVDLTTSARHIFTASLNDKEQKRDDQDDTMRLKRIDANTIEMVDTNATRPPQTRRWQVKGNTLVETLSGTGPDGKPFQPDYAGKLNPA
ncbi:MAG TPA: hypothetical protein VIY49_02440 [Bryobacteraceae bacterium]